ncbi:MAG TPA: hypothetical protein PLG22_07205 [Kiritimatiellia bacterium]|nr:hypothetical protein [Kiritimatiellia bacterium]
MKRNPYSSHTNPVADGIRTLSALPPSGFNGVRQGEPLPSRLKILPWGTTRTTDGDTVSVNAQTAELLPATQRELNWPHAHIDIEHATIPGTPLFKLAAQNGRFPAVLGYGTPLVIPGEGLFVDAITWSPQSKRAYEFPDISGVVKHLADGTVTALHSFAFCCHGKAEGVTAYSALLDPTNETETEDELMDKLMMALLGLDANADDATKLDRATKLGAALAALPAGPDGAKAMSALLKLDAGKLAALSQLDAAKLTALSQLSATDLEAKIKTLSQMDEGSAAAMTALGKRLGTIEADFKTLSQDAAGLRRAKILSDAAAKGKAVPEAWLAKYGDNLAVLSDMIDGLPENVVSLSQSADPSARHRVTPDGKDAAEVAKAFGRKPEDLKGF